MQLADILHLIRSSDHGFKSGWNEIFGYYSHWKDLHVSHKIQLSKKILSMDICQIQKHLTRHFLPLLDQQQLQNSLQVIVCLTSLMSTNSEKRLSKTPHVHFFQ